MNLSDLVTVGKNAVQAVNNLTQKITQVFPQASAAVTQTATAGTASLPAQPAGFLTVTVNGTAYKVPLYNP